MKIVYTNENSLIVNNVKNVLEQIGIEVQLKNEFVRSALGEVAAQHTWLEIWVVKENEFEKASEIVKHITNKASDDEWQCKNCNENNDSSFEICWNCQNENI
jgi:hypothetical protein